jgi:hypothetical protein
MRTITTSVIANYASITGQRLSALKKKSVASSSRSHPNGPRRLLPRHEATVDNDENSPGSSQDERPYNSSSIISPLLLINDDLSSQHQSDITDLQLIPSANSLEPSVLFTSAMSFSVPLGSDHAHIGTYGLSVYSALFTNGLLLGIVCGHHVPSATPPQSDLIPISLHPTRLQQTTIHSQWIDQFPFPSLKDKTILMGGSCEALEELFQREVFTTESFKIKVGGVSWEAKDWRINPAFKQRWEFLFN